METILPWARSVATPQNITNALSVASWMVSNPVVLMCAGLLITAVVVQKVLKKNGYEMVGSSGLAAAGAVVHPCGAYLCWKWNIG